jgi:hypothetical protein
VAFEEADEVVFEVGLGGAPLGRQLGCAAARVSGEEGGQLGGGDESLDLGLVEGSGQLSGREDVGEVDERAGRGGDAHPVVDGGVLVAGAVDEDLLEPMLGRRGHLRRCVPARNDPPQCRRRTMAQDRIRAAGEDR